MQELNVRITYDMVKIIMPTITPEDWDIMMNCTAHRELLFSNIFKCAVMSAQLASQSLK